MLEDINAYEGFRELLPQLRLMQVRFENFALDMFNGTRRLFEQLSKFALGRFSIGTCQHQWFVETADLGTTQRFLVRRGSAMGRCNKVFRNFFKLIL